MKTGWWKIEYTIKPDEYDLDHIAELIRQGFTEGEIVQEEEAEAAIEVVNFINKHRRS